MHDNIVWRVQWFAIPFVGKDRDCPVVFVANDPARVMFARKLTAFEIKCVSVAIVRWLAKNADVIVLIQQSHLAVVRNVTPNQETSASVPCTALSPERTGP